MKPVNPTLITIEVNVQYAENIQSVVDQSEELISEEIWQNGFQTWLNHLEDYLPSACAYELTLRLTNDAEIQQLNAQYRFKDQPTDVLAFAALETDFPTVESSEPLYLGDIIISLDTACQKALKQGHSLKTEVIWLASHGLLHLLGWDHPDEESLEEMLRFQETLLQSLGISSSLR